MIWYTIIYETVTTVRLVNTSIPSQSHLFICSKYIKGELLANFKSTIQHYAIYIPRTHLPYNWYLLSNISPLPSSTAPGNHQSTLCPYELESYFIINGSWGIYGELRKMVQLPCSLITLYWSIFLATLLCKVSIYWLLFYPLEIQRKVRNAYERATLLAMANHRALVIRAMVVTLHLPCSDFFWGIVCLSSILNASWGHRSFHILVSMTFRRFSYPSLALIWHTTFSPLLLPYHWLRAHLHCCCLPGSREAVGHNFSPPPATLLEDGQVAGAWPHF